MTVIIDGNDGVTFPDNSTQGTNPAFGNKLLHVRDEKPPTVDGGTFSAGAWRARDLNTEMTNEIAGASLSANQMTLPAGVYYTQIRTPRYNTTRGQARLQDITSNVTLLVGAGSYSVNQQTENTVLGRFTLAGTTVLEVQHRAQNTQSGDGFGVASDFGEIEVYTDVQIWKVA